MSENKPGSGIVQEKKVMPRRQFLKWGAIVTGSIILSSGEIEKQAISYIANFFADPQNGEKTLKFITDRFGSDSENPHFRPIDAIILEGINAFEHRTGKKALYRRSPDYRDFSYYQSQIEEAKKTIGILPVDPGKIVQLFVTSFPPLAKSAYTSSEVGIGGYLDLLSNGSGMYTRFSKEFPSYAGKPLLGQVIDKAKQKAAEYTLEAKNFVEQEVSKNGSKPVSASRLFEFFLGKNEGDIAQSLTDTYIFLKFASRNNFETGNYTANEQNVAWMKMNILDEYGSKSYDRDIGDSINLIGKPYHSWNLIALLPYFPVEVIHMAGVFRQVTRLDQQGIAKLHSDLLTLSELKATEKRLLDYQS